MSRAPRRQFLKTMSCAAAASLLSPDSDFDSVYTSAQSVIRDGDGYRMYYGARIDLVHTYFAIGLATKQGSLLEP